MDYSVGIVLGMYWSSLLEFIDEKLNMKKLLCTIIESVSVVFIFLFMTYTPVFKLNSYRVLFYPFILLFIIVFTYSNGYISRLLSNKYLYKLGILSMSIYMSHYLILELAKGVDLSLIYKIPASYVVVLLFSFIIYKLIPYVSSKFIVACNRMFGK